MADTPIQNAPPPPAEAAQPPRNTKSGVHLNLIFEVGRASLSKLEMSDLLDTAAQAIQRHFGYYDVSIFLLDPDAQECVLVAHAGDYNSEGIKGYRQKLSVGIVGWVAGHGQTVLANNVRNDPRHVVAFLGEAELLSELTVPIRLHGKTLGVINVERREVNAFDDSDVMTMETLSDQLAQAIANAQLFEQTNLLLDLNRSVLEAVPSSLCVLDSQMRILFTNPRFCRFFGRAAEEVHGMDMRQLLPAALFQQSGLESAIHRAAAESEPLLCPDLCIQAPISRSGILTCTSPRRRSPKAAACCCCSRTSPSGAAPARNCSARSRSSSTSWTSSARAWRSSATITGSSGPTARSATGSAGARRSSDAAATRSIAGATQSASPARPSNVSPPPSTARRKSSWSAPTAPCASSTTP